MSCRSNEKTHSARSSSRPDPSFHHAHYDPSTIDASIDRSLLSSVLTSHDIASDNIWIFGFGSLLHTPGFEYSEKRSGYIRGWRRVWWQGSTDHRGTSEFPGRTVTLVEEEGAVTWGVAYKLSGGEAEQLATLEYLEWREKQYDRRAYVRLYDGEGEGAELVIDNELLCYVATNSPRNPNFLGPPESLEALASQVVRAVGPSGKNSEYVLKLRDEVLRAGAGGSDVEELMALGRLVEEKTGA